MRSSDPPIILKLNYNTTVANLWQALTDYKHMRKWYFEALENFVSEVGFKTRFSVSVEDRTYTHNWQVTEVVPLHKIIYTWKFDEYEGSSYSLFELTEQENHTKLTLTIVTTADFPSGIPEFKTESCIAGWEYFLNNRLRSYIEK